MTPIRPLPEDLDLPRGLHSWDMACRYGLTKPSRAGFARIAKAVVGVNQYRVHIQGAPSARTKVCPECVPDENMKIRLMENRNPLKSYSSSKCPDLDTAISAACAPPAAA